MFRVDTLLCHNFSNALNGLWFGIFIYLFFVVVGICLFGPCICKQPEHIDEYKFDYQQNIF